MAKGERFKHLARELSHRQSISYSKARKLLRQQVVVSPKETTVSKLDRNVQLIAVRAWLRPNSLYIPEPKQGLVEMLELGNPEDIWGLIAECPELGDIIELNLGTYGRDQIEFNLASKLLLLRSPHWKELNILQVEENSLEDLRQILKTPAATLAGDLWIYRPDIEEEGDTVEIQVLETDTGQIWTIVDPLGGERLWLVHDDGRDTPLTACEFEERIKAGKYSLLKTVRQPTDTLLLNVEDLEPLQNLDWLHLEIGYSLSPEAMAFLCRGIWFLELRGGDDGNVLLEALAKVENGSVGRLSLPKKGITSEGIQHLVASSILPGLENLSLHVNPIGTEGAQLLAEKAHLFEHLKTLTLEGCEIGDEGALALANAPFPSLKDLELGSNGISDKGALALAQGSLIARLKYLKVKRNPITPLGVRALKDAWGPRKGTLGIGEITNSLEDLPIG